VHLKPALESGGDSRQGWLAHAATHVRHLDESERGEDIKTIQELLRHSNYKVTADTYTQAVTPTKRAAHTKLVKMILVPSKQAGEKQASGE
jgi:integrase